MTKLMNLNLQNAEILDKKEMKLIAGGSTDQCVCTKDYNPETGGPSYCFPPGCYAASDEENLKPGDKIGPCVGKEFKESCRARYSDGTLYEGRCIYVLTAPLFCSELN